MDGSVYYYEHLERSLQPFVCLQEILLMKLKRAQIGPKFANHFSRESLNASGVYHQTA